MSQRVSEQSSGSIFFFLLKKKSYPNFVFFLVGSAGGGSISRGKAPVIDVKKKKNFYMDLATGI